MIREKSTIRLSKLWEELKNWKHDWTKSTFFQALVFGLFASLFDCGTDFYFAWNVPKDCQHNDDTLNFQTHVSTPCGTFHYKNVEAFTYSAIALPGILLGMAGLQCLIRHILSKCFPGQIHWCIRGTANAISLVLEVLFNLTLLFAATRNDIWSYEAASKARSCVRHRYQGPGLPLRHLHHRSQVPRTLQPRARNKPSYPPSD